MVEIGFQLGDPVEHRGIVVTPLFPRRDPVAAYVTLGEALPRGFRLQEVSSAGSVAELLVENPLDEDVLLYDGEELVGAKQDRILNVSVLVAAGSKVPIPVSCVEQGRWSRRSDVFAAAPHAAAPELRRRKAQALRERPLERGIAQSEVWDAVAARANELRVSSRTGASGDTYRALRPALAELESAFPLQPGQCGAVLALGEDLCLDAVSRPGAFARLYPKLRTGYLLDAADRPDWTGHAAGDRVVVRHRPVVGNDRARAVGRPGRRPPLARIRCSRLGSRARRRADPARGVHERGRRPKGLQPHRAPERSAATRFLATGTPQAGGLDAPGVVLYKTEWLDNLSVR